MVVNDDVLSQTIRVIVNDHREQARSYIYGYPLFCNTVFDEWLACFHLSGV